MKYVKLIFRLLLGAFMTYAGISHLTFNRQEFVVCGTSAHMVAVQPCIY